MTPCSPGPALPASVPSGAKVRTAVPPSGSVTVVRSGSTAYVQVRRSGPVPRWAAVSRPRSSYSYASAGRSGPVRATSRPASSNAVSVVRPAGSVRVATRRPGS
ncbi:hypothetical protein BJF78_08065 [Pseudonocardia sp. CNS-139]|nr:hypothetical protein BJF78_08065 [Pseudonocardia sp. CNS-139]